MGRIPPPPPPYPPPRVVGDLNRLKDALGPSLRRQHVGHPGQVLTMVNGSLVWAYPEPEPEPKAELVLRCGACGTKHVANTQRCGACGCPDRLNPIEDPKPEAIMQKRRDYFSVFRRALRHIDIYPFSGGGTESPGPN